MNPNRRNTLCLYGELAFSGVQAGITGTFLSIYALRLGATNQDIGLLSSLPALAAIVAVLPSARVVERRKQRRDVLVRASFTYRLQYFLMALLPFLDASLRIPALIAIVGLAAIPSSMAGVAFTSIFSEVIPKGSWARVNTTRWLIGGLSSAAAAAATGRFLDAVPAPLNYQLAFVIASAFAMGSTAVYRLMAVPEAHPVQSQKALSSWHERVRGLLAAMPRNRAYSAFIAASFLAHLGQALSRPLFSIYWVRNLHASDAWIGIIATTGSMLTLTMYRLWGRIADRWGNRRVLLIGCLGLALYPAVTNLVRRPEWMVGPAIALGVFTPAFNLGFYNGLLHVVPEGDRRRPTYIAGYTATNSIAAFLGPIVSTSFLLPVGGMGFSLLAAAVVYVLGWLSVYLSGRQLLLSRLSARLVHR